MKVGFTTYPMNFQTKGGLEVQIRQTERALLNLGIDVQIVNPYAQKLKEFDIIHLFSLRHAGLRTLQHARSYGVPCVTTPLVEPLCSSFQINKVRFICYLLLRLLGQEFRTEWHDIMDGLLLSGVICAITNQEKKVIEQLVPSTKGRVYVTPNGITQEFFTANPDYFKSRHPGFGSFILMPSSIFPLKNQLLVIEAAKSLGYRTILVGSILDQDYFDLCMTAGEGAVTYLGEYEYPSESLTSVFAAARVVVLASTFEAFGLVPFEALASGTPAILTKASGYDRLPNPPYFQWVDPCSIEDIKRSLRVAWDAPRNREACRDSVNDMQWSSVGRSLMEIYESILETKGS